MKLKILIIFSFSFLSNFCYSQITFYPKLGLNYSYLGEIDYPPVPIETEWITGINTGIGLSFRINKTLELNSELVWSAKGGKNTFFHLTEPILTRTYKYNYLSLPLFAKLKVKKIGFFIGFEPSYFVGGKIKLENGDKFSLGGSPSRPDKKLDYSLLVGLSYDLTEKIFVDVRYTHGLTTIYTYVPHRINGMVFNDGIEKHRIFSLSIGYYLSKRKN